MTYSFLIFALCILPHVKVCALKSRYLNARWKNQGRASPPKQNNQGLKTTVLPTWDFALFLWKLLISLIAFQKLKILQLQELMAQLSKSELNLMLFWNVLRFCSDKGINIVPWNYPDCGKTWFYYVRKQMCPLHFMWRNFTWGNYLLISQRTAHLLRLVLARCTRF